MNKRQKKNLIKIITALVLSLIIYFIPLSKTYKLVLYLIPYLIVGYDVLITAFKNIIHGQIFDEKFLMSIATIGAFILGEYFEAVAVMLFYQVGELFQSIAVNKSRKSIAKLMDIRPLYANVIRDGKEEQVDPEEVLLGETIIVKPGEKIPIDGVIVKGNSSINASALTGESLPIDKFEGDNVISGSINISGLLKIKTEKDYQDSTVSKILELIENASENKSKVENFITKFAKYYTPFVVFSAVIIAVLLPLITGGNWNMWITRALIFLVVSCPCALVVSVPLSFFGGIGRASKEGILIKGASYVEVLSKVKTIAFDKTGTITKGVFEVNAIHPTDISKEELLDIAATTESYSSHPVALSIIKAHGGHIEKSRIKEINEISGKGIKAVIDGKTFYVGNSKLMEDVKANWHNCHLSGTIIHISQDDIYLGHIVISDTIKEDSIKAISDIKELGIKKVVMLTGDNKSVAENVAEKAGINEVYSDLLPDKKVEIIEKLVKEDVTAFVGDGINDAPVIVRSDVGIAMGAMGSDAAIESADIVLMDDKLSKISTAIKISRKTMRIARQNIIFALLVKAIILVLGALGIANMWIAVFGDVGVMILAILNSTRAMLK